jgi:hypothetical protein
LSSVEILSPEGNFSSSHTTKTTSFRRCGIAEAGVARDFLPKTGLESDVGPVEPEQGAAKSNRAYAVSSYIKSSLKKCAFYAALNYTFYETCTYALHAAFHAAFIRCFL